MVDSNKIDIYYNFTKNIILQSSIFKIDYKKKKKFVKKFKHTTQEFDQSFWVSKYKINRLFFDLVKKNVIVNRRVLNEIFKTLITSDIICLVLDVRDPIGTWSNLIMNKINFFKKKLIIILNKIDLVPCWVTSNWLKIFSKNYCVVAFHCNSNNNKNFGKNVLLKIIKSIKKESFSKKIIIIGVIGYPNVGKSALINTIKSRTVTKTSSIPGYTKVRQIIKLSKKIFIIDTPGILYKSNSTHNIFLIRGNVLYNKNTNDNKNFVSLIKKIIGTYSKKEKKKLMLKKKKIVSLKRNGIVDKTKRENLFIADFLSGNIPWFAPIPMQICSTLNCYNFPWTGNFLI